MAKKTQRRKRKPAGADNPIAHAESMVAAEDRRRYIEALGVMRAGGKPNREQLRGAKRHEAREEERQRWEFYASIPQKHWKKMSGGRPTQTINKQAETYGIPFGGATVDLPAVVLALHEFLAKHARVLAMDKGNGEGDALLIGPESPALERYRDERAKLAKLDRMERERSLLRRDDVHEALGRISHVLGEATGALRRQYGNDAAAIIDDAITDAEVEIERYFGE